MLTPYYAADGVELYLGDCRQVLPELGLTFDVAICDPPYGETSLAWDRWPDGWPSVVAGVTRGMWCFGSLRMFLRYRDQFDAWKLSQDVVWHKNTAVGRATDRFRRAHEQVAFWYQGSWSDIYKSPRRVASQRRDQGTSRNGAAPKKDVIGEYRTIKTWVDDGTRLMTSVIYAANMHGNDLNPTAKPVPLLSPLIAYSCPPGGRLLVPFAGSGAELEAARLSGRDAVGIELREEQCEAAAKRLSQGDLFAAEELSADAAAEGGDAAV